jgi:NTE family protein
MVTGQMVVLKDGDLATAMRASMAIPGAFAPVTMDNYILNDGGLVRNIPIDVARDLCADHVIVVNLVEPNIDPKRLRTATQLLSRTMDVMIEANETLQLQTIRPGDVRIDVEMGDITTADFERVPDTIPLGEAATRAKATELAQFVVPEAQYTAWRQKVTQSQNNRGADSRACATRAPNASIPVPRRPPGIEGRRSGRQRQDQHRGAAHGGPAGFESWAIGSMVTRTTRRSPGCRARRAGDQTT